MCCRVNVPRPGDMAQAPLAVHPIHLRGRTAVSNEIGLISGRSASGNAAGPGQGNRILIFESILIYQHFHPEPLTPHPEPVEGLHPLPLILSLEGPHPLPLILPLILSLLPLILSPLPLILSKEPLHYFCWIIPPAHPNRPLSRPPSWPWTIP